MAPTSGSLDACYYFHSPLIFQGEPDVDTVSSFSLVPHRVHWTRAMVPRSSKIRFAWSLANHSGWTIEWH